MDTQQVPDGAAARPDAARPVELRIHGVGGSTPEALLGVGREAQVERVADGPVSAFYRRRRDPRRPQDHDVEAYVWGGLTTRSTFQPLWLFLLPFTLLNVAGWLHRSSRGTVVDGVIRRLVGVVGFSLTAAWSLWISIIVFDYLTWAAIGPRLSGGIRLALGTVGCAVLLLATYLVSRHFTKDFERVEPVLAASAPAGLPIEDPRFWSQKSRRTVWTFEGERDDSWTGEQTVVHVLIALGTSVVAWVVAFTAVRAEQPPALLGLGRLMVPVLAIQLLLLLALAIASGWDSLRPQYDGDGDGDHTAPGPRVLRAIGPAGAATMAVGITYGALSGLTRWLGDNVAGVSDAAGRPDQVLTDVVGLAAVVLVATLVAVLFVYGVVHPWRSTPEADAPISTRPHGTRLDGLPNQGWVRRVRRRRGLARVLSRIGWVLALPSLVFLLYGLVKLAPGGRIATVADLLTGAVGQPTACAGNVVTSTGRWLVSTCGGLAADPTWMAHLGAWIVATVMVAGPPYLFSAARSRKQRSGVGIIWDVLTFWPRWHHPFAVRCYAERAVPELQHRLERLLRPDVPGGAPAATCVVLSAHSQGSVLAYAALASLPDDLVDRVALVTYGAPLTTLYARYFPAYLGRARDGRALAERLPSWHNFYRDTDYVGRRVDRLDAGDSGNHELPDPVPDPRDDEDVLALWDDEAPLTPWTVFAGHSHYRTTSQVRRAIRDAIAVCQARRVRQPDGPLTPV